MELKVKAVDREYSIHIGRNLLDNIDEYITFPNKTLILTDDNIPYEYIEKICEKASNVCICTVKNGEESKSLATYEEVLKVPRSAERPVPPIIPCSLHYEFCGLTSILENFILFGSLCFLLNTKNLVCSCTILSLLRSSKIFI